jgi:hypothetical protein
MTTLTRGASFDLAMGTTGCFLGRIDGCAGHVLLDGGNP